MSTKSQILQTDPQRVLDLIDGWITSVAMLEQHAEDYLGHVQRPGGSYWEGATAEAAKELSRQDFQAVAKLRDTIDLAARQISNTVSSSLMPPLANAKQIIANAESNRGVHVNDDRTITYDPPEGTNTVAAEANARIVAEAEAELKSEAAKWWAAENAVADQIGKAETAAGDIINLAAALPRKSPSTAATGKPRIQLVDRHTPLPEDPAPMPPTDPRMTTEQARAAYGQLQGEISHHNSNPPPASDAGAVNTYNNNADALNARKAALEAELGKSETVPAQRSHFVPDWAHPAPEHLPVPASHRFDLSTPHAQELGTDPGIGGRFRPGEAETGLRVEAERGIQLVRSPHEGVDWIDPTTGKTYDAMGNFDQRHLKMNIFLPEIERHAAKSDYVPVDVSQFSAEQRSIIRRFIVELRNPKGFHSGRLRQCRVTSSFFNITGRAQARRSSL
ncbi:hypothetical protein [Mycobacterium sp. TY815]|uniref:hypothetical protein n=1 Tax=Mycobacterium sp. TY815 TaxID=3050581 RepID=UPI0027409072|nr:hypothetical protein [Mycobacterium sp. TY815]MDP7703986.1 hypothetical protein [Mycobacterium sp. TY815]